MIINCEKQLAKDIEYQHSGVDMEKKNNKVDDDGPGIVDVSGSRNIGEDQKIPETMISKEQRLQTVFSRGASPSSQLIRERWR